MTELMIAPHDSPAEESVLGAMIVSDRAIEAASEILLPSDFSLESHGTLFVAITELHAEGCGVDMLTLADRLEKSGKLNAVGGRSRIAALAGGVTTTSNVGHWANIVRETATLRRLLLAANNIGELVTHRRGDIDTIIAQAEAELTKATMHNVSSTIAPITDGMEELLSEIREAYRSKEAIFGLRTGFRDLDNALLGFWPGQLILLAARPSQGKSALALNIAENFADADLTCLFASLEMSQRELQIRAFSRAGRLDSQRLQTGLLEEEEAKRFSEAVKLVKARAERLFIDDDSTVTVQKLAATAARMKRQNDLSLIVVDYLQLISTAGIANRSEEIGQISRGLKLLARKLDVPILALSQMNRAIEQRSEKRPTLSDLRDSGSLEQDADTVIFLHDDAAYDSSKAPDGEIEIIVAKNRRGPCGSVKLLYSRRHNRFHDAPIGGAA